MWSDGLLWGLASLAALIGVGLLLRGWWWDRARGRRRCPKCWYVISDGVSRCSECGFEAKRERQWLKTRRKKRVMALAMVVVMGAGVLALTPKARRDGWPSMLPSWVMIETFAWFETDIYRDELARRGMRIDYDLIDDIVYDDLEDGPPPDRRRLRDRVCVGLSSGSPHIREQSRKWMWALLDGAISDPAAHRGLDGYLRHVEGGLRPSDASVCIEIAKRSETLDGRARCVRTIAEHDLPLMAPESVGFARAVLIELIREERPEAVAAALTEAELARLLAPLAEFDQDEPATPTQ